MRGIHHSEDFSWSNAPRGSGGGGTNTVSQSVQIPAYEQQFSSENQDLARALASNPYPAYNQPLVQGFAPQQEQGMAMAGQAAGAYQPDLNYATALNAGAGWQDNGVSNTALGGAAIGDAMGIPTSAYFTGANVMGNAINNGSPANAQTMASFMSPYVQQALAPQLLGLQTQLGQEQNKIDAQATQANAFGDARQGAAQALQNFYGNQAISGVLGQGYNTAFSNALQSALQEQQLQGNLGAALTQAGNQFGQLRMAQGQDLANLGMGAASNLGQLGASEQSLGIAGANALFNAGQQQQTLGQQELNQAYQQFLNQANWPYQMLNVRESALSNSPYNMVNATTVPQANMAAQGFGSALAGVGSLAQLLGGSGGGNNAPFGGSSYPSGH